MQRRTDRDAVDVCIAGKIARSDPTVSLDVVQHYGDALLQKFAEHLGPADAEELLVKVLDEAIAKFRGEKGASFRTFLFLVAKRRLIDRLRARGSATTIRLSDAPVVALAQAPGNTLDVMAEAELKTKRLDAIHGAIAMDLTPLEREAVRRRYRPDEPPDAMAGERSDSAWRRALTSGVAKIRKRVLALESEEGGCRDSSAEGG
jgi:DNA-directed RNA polymerase specialized sigma24 family protein